MRRSVPLLVLFAAVAALLAPSRASAMPEGHYWWLSPMVGWGQFSDKLRFPTDSLADAPIFGARLGHAFGGGWGIELGGSYSSTHGEDSVGTSTDDVKVMNISGSLMFTPVSWALGSPYLAVAGGYNQYKSDAAPDDLHYGTFEQALGWQAWFGDHTALRLEARNILNIPHKNWGNASKADQQYWGGLTFAWGGKPKDTDLDGVPDRKDKCPDTPKGAVVDENGCPIDSDGDGVFDGLDQCTGTPKGATVDAKGCPSDSDGDGVYDGIDQCPDTPKGATVDARGCPTDSDSDGVYDGIDQCPNTPKGCTVDATGCPKDSDNDGVCDGIDKCPDTPAAAKVDSDGCPIVVSEKETELLDTGMIRLQNVNFETAKANILPESYPVLDEVGAILRKWPQLKIEIGGHCDSRGSDAYNLRLSDARAKSVKDYLVAKFPDLAADQLSTRGYGESKPIAKNNSALNMAKNRRVEFVVLNRDVLKKEVERRKLLEK